MPEVAPSTDFQRSEVGGQNRDFDAVRIAEPSQSDFAVGQEISDADIAEVINSSLGSDDTEREVNRSHVILRDDYEAEIRAVGEGRYRIEQMLSVARGLD